MKTFVHPMIYQREFSEQKLRVRRHKHFKIVHPPKDWKDVPEYQNFLNDNLDLCGFIEFNGELITTVY